MVVAHQDVREDFAPLRFDVLGVLLFGSHASGAAHERSDVDVCLVAGPGTDAGEALRKAWRLPAMGRRRYDVKVFEDLPLFLKGEVLDTGVLVLSRDEPALSEYLRRFRKIWGDQARRNRPNAEDWERIVEARRSTTIPARGTVGPTPGSSAREAGRS